MATGVRSRAWWIVAAATALISLLLVLWARTRPGFDPYGWLVWGRQTLSWSLDTNAAPSWKSLPYVFTGYRLSLGLAWLVIVASEMLTGTPGVGGFLWQEYNSLVYSHIILSVITIGAIGFLLDRLMGLIEARMKAA